jgi:hypothetical protein
VSIARKLTDAATRCHEKVQMTLKNVDPPRSTRVQDGSVSNQLNYHRITTGVNMQEDKELPKARYEMKGHSFGDDHRLVCLLSLLQHNVCIE